TRFDCDWSSDVCSSDLVFVFVALCAITALLVLVVVRDRLFRRYLSPYDWLAPLSAFLFLLFVAAPSGALGGGYLRPRLWLLAARSEERRVGKEGRGGWS